MKSIRLEILFFLLVTLSLVSCFKKAPDSPPDTSNENPNIVVTASINKLKNLTLGQEITEDIVVSGVVIMSDKSGNYFKSIVIQDTSGGIEIAIDRIYLYADFPEGRRVFVRCKGLYLSKRNDMITLGYTPDANGYVRPIPEPMIGQFLFHGQFPVNVTPKLLSLYQLSVPDYAEKYLNTLVQINDVQFEDSLVARHFPYAMPSDVLSSTALTLKDCSGTSIFLRTSAYANFQAITIPIGNGSIRAVYTRDKAVSQLIIRDTSDVRFNQERCNNLPVAGSAISVKQLRQIYLSSHVTSLNYKINVVVISDKAAGNIEENNFILQGGNEDAGIALQTVATADFELGDSLEINLEGGVLYRYFGMLTMKDIPAGQIRKVAIKRSIRPLDVNISQLKQNPGSFESRLVRLKQIEWLQYPSVINGTSGNLMFSDGTDSVSHFCEQSAVFKSQQLSSKYAQSLTGYVFLKNGQLFLRMRNMDDLKL